MDYLACCNKKEGGGLSTSDCISEDLASKSGGMLRLDRTPSVEELPMDQAGEHLGEHLGEQHGHSTPTTTPSRSAHGKTPNSIITSVTSIASLDTGYQGDGEWSRPGSRGPDHSPTGHPHPHPPHPHPPHPHPHHAGIKIKGTAVDPMTDSDFFTESDADMQEERMGVAGRGGDRHAQVQ